MINLKYLFNKKHISKMSIINFFSLYNMFMHSLRKPLEQYPLLDIAYYF